MTRQAKQRILEAKIKHYKEKYPNTPEGAYSYYDKSDKTANGLEQCICDFMKFEGHFSERIKNQGRKVDKTEVVSDVLGRRRVIGSSHYIAGSGTNGTSDVKIQLAPYGITWSCEVKIGKDRQSEAQQTYQAKVTKVGGYYTLTHTFDEFLEQYDNILQDINKRFTK